MPASPGLRRRGLTALALAVATATVAAWFAPSRPIDALTYPQVEAGASNSLSEPAESRLAESYPVVLVEPVAPSSANISEPPPTLAGLERRFRTARAPADRQELAAEIASWNDSAAAVAIQRLFRAERHPKVKVALLANLADINAAASLDVRLSVLADALSGQPREVRITALDMLAQLDDSRVALLLKRMIATDPDHEVRELAAALHRARFEPTR